MGVKTFHNWKILTKIMTISILTVAIFIGVVMLVFIPMVERNVMEKKQESVRQVVEVAYAIIAGYGDRAKSGAIPEAEARKKAAEEIKGLRYSEKEYFWINDLGPKMVMHPTKPELDGQDLSGNKDPQGKYLFVEFVKVAKDKGAGVVDYMWPKPGESTPVPKISYVKLFQPWGWIIGSGIYVDNVKKEVAVLRAEMIGAALLVGLLAILVSFYIGHLITRPLKKVVGSLKQVAAGDLSGNLQINSTDETGELAESLNTAVGNMRMIITEVLDSSANVVSAASELYATAEQIATGTEEVAAQAGTVATAGQEMAATSSDISRSCTHVAESSKLANEAALEGVAEVQESVKDINQIATKVNEVAEKIKTLSSRSEEIGEIIKTIEDIADQTNLLALNAAIEAARAGEQGRGFAVVADEVRALAERTTRATREIGEMIKAIQIDTNSAVESIEEGVEEVEKGTAEAAESGKSLQEILKQVTEVTNQVNQIATAAEEQTATTTEISNNIMQITNVVQGAARGAEESATAANELARLAEDLQKLVRKFKLAA